jgi:four helix bundle protein
MKSESEGRRNVVRDKSYAFALRVIALVRLLRRVSEYEIGGQLLRSGTSVGANIEEAQAAQSRADFVAKMSIAAKEARESHYWLRLLRDSRIGPADEVTGMIRDADELVRFLTAIVKTGQQGHS